MTRNFPHKPSSVSKPLSFSFGEDLVLVLNLGGKATITPHDKGWEQTLTIMNKGPDENIKIERNGNLIVITQPEFSLLKNGPRPDVEIFVPHTFERLTMNLSGSAEVTGKAFPYATVIKAQDDAQIVLTTHDCFAETIGGVQTELTIAQKDSSHRGMTGKIKHDLVLVSWNDGYTTINGDIGKAYMLVANKCTARNLATINEAYLFTPRGYWSYEFIAQTGLMRNVHEKGLSLNGLQRKAAQMWRGFNACVRSKAAARLEA